MISRRGRLADSGLRQFFETNHAARRLAPPFWDLNALTMAAFYYHHAWTRPCAVGRCASWD